MKCVIQFGERFTSVYSYFVIKSLKLDSKMAAKLSFQSLLEFTRHALYLLSYKLNIVSNE